MPSARRLPFRGLTLRQWLNLALAAMVAFYEVFAIFYILSGGLCDHMGADYRSFLSSARIVRSQGFDKIYQWQIQDQEQFRLYQECPAPAGSARVAYAMAPTYYLPVFVLPFLPLVVFDFVSGLWLWLLLNAAVMVLYLWWFLKKSGGRAERGIIFQAMLCLPVFSNLILGQANVWLLICIGQFLLVSLYGRQFSPVSQGGLLRRAGKWVVATVRDREFRSGLWLAGLLLKPQTLVLLAPALLVGRRFKALAGLAAATLVVLLASFLLVGTSGLLDLLNLYRISSIGEATTHADTMVNWRAFGLLLRSFLPAEIAWGIAFAGIILTSLVALSFWLRSPLRLTRRLEQRTVWSAWLARLSTVFQPAGNSPAPLGLALLGTYAATCASTWHSHIHMTLPMIPLLLFLYTQEQISWPILYLWLYAPSALLPIALFIHPDLVDNLVALGMFVLNLYLVYWVAHVLRRGAPNELGGKVAEEGRGTDGAPS